MPARNPIRLHASPTGVFVAGTKPRPTFTEEQLEAAKREAHHQGSEEASRGVPTRWASVPALIPLGRGDRWGAALTGSQA